VGVILGPYTVGPPIPVPAFEALAGFGVPHPELPLPGVADVTAPVVIGG